MANIFQGLGRGLGAAAQGYLQGQNKGEAEIYRRQQAEQNAELKRLALAARKRELDPNKPIQEHAARVHLQTRAILDDPLKAADLQKINPEAYQKLLRRANRAWGVVTGQVDPKLWFEEDQAEEAGAAGAGPQVPPDAPITELPGGRPLPPDFPQIGADADTAIPNLGGGMTVPRPAPDLNLLRRTAGIFPNLLQLAPQGETQAPQTAPPPKKVDLAARLQEIVAQEPVQEPGEHPKRFQERYNRWSRDITTLSSAITATSAATKRAEETKFVAPKAQAQIKKLGTGAELDTERTETERALRPGKKQLQGSRIAQIADNMKRGWATLDETKRHNRRSEAVQQMNAETARLRQTDTAAYHRALVDQVKFRINNFPAAELGKNERARLSAAVKILSAQMALPGGMKTSAAVGQANQAASEIDSILQRMDAQAGLEDGNAWAMEDANAAVGAGTAAPPAPRASAPKSGLRRLIEGSDDAHLRVIIRQMKGDPGRAAGIPVLLKEYRAVKGRAWKG